MRQIRKWIVGVSLAISAPVFAHHSISVDYDTTKPVILTGKVTKVDWINPHAFFYVDAKDPTNSESGNWAIELGSLNSLIRLGWTRNSLRIGEAVTVRGIRAIGGRRMVNARLIKLASTGEQLSTWEGAATSDR